MIDFPYMSNSHLSQIDSDASDTVEVVASSQFDGLIAGKGRPKALYMLGHESLEMIFPPHLRASLGELLDIVEPSRFTDTDDLDLSGLEEVEVLLSGWKMRPLDQELLDAMPNLKVVFYGAGTIRYITTPEFWKRDILISSSYAMNAVPVAEYTLSTILLSLKHFWKYSIMAKSGQGWTDYTRPQPGVFGTKVGFVSCGMVARKTIQLMEPFDLDLSVYCPFLTACEADGLGVTRASLEDIFCDSDVVSLHTPNLPETEGLIGREHFSLMRNGATFINTARGQIVREDELIEVAQERPDLTFILDVTYPEPPAKDSLLLTLPNVVLTPHIAGSMGSEVERLGDSVLQEVTRYLAGEPLKWSISEELCKTMA